MSNEDGGRGFDPPSYFMYFDKRCFRSVMGNTDLRYFGMMCLFLQILKNFECGRHFVFIYNPLLNTVEAR